MNVIVIFAPLGNKFYECHCYIISIPLGNVTSFISDVMLDVNYIKVLGMSFAILVYH